MPQASFFASARSCDLDPDGGSLRDSDAAAERQPYATAVIAIDAIERRVDGVDGGVPRCHEIACASTRRVVVSGATNLSWWVSRGRQNDGRCCRDRNPCVLRTNGGIEILPASLRNQLERPRRGTSDVRLTRAKDRECPTPRAVQKRRLARRGRRRSTPAIREHHRRQSHQ